MTSDKPIAASPGALLAPTPRRQYVGFMIGSALFALGSAPHFATWAGASATNVSYFVGAWFFTGAALIQLLVSGPATVQVSYPPGVMARVDWMSASTQMVGTVLFNISTTVALTANTVSAEQQLVWNPDAGGAVAFLISGGLALYALYRTPGREPVVRDREWWSTQVNMLGCIAFGVSAVGGFVTGTGGAVDASVASVGTFVGAICFFVASAMMLGGEQL